MSEHAHAKNEMPADHAEPVSDDAALEPIQSQPMTPEELERVSTHYDLVESVARRMASRHIGDLDDLLGDGYLGLVRAARNYDRENRGEGATTDSTYFQNSIAGAIRRGMRDRYGRVREKLYAPDGRHLRTDDRMAFVNPSVLTGTASSLDEPVKSSTDEPQDITLGDRMADPLQEEQFNAQLFRGELEDALAGLSAKDREVYERRKYLGQTLTETGEAMGISHMAVSRRERKIDAMLQDKLADYNS